MPKIRAQVEPTGELDHKPFEVDCSPTIRGIQGAMAWIRERHMATTPLVLRIRSGEWGMLQAGLRADGYPAEERPSMLMGMHVDWVEDAGPVRKTRRRALRR